MGGFLLSADRIARKRYGIGLISAESMILLHVSLNEGATIKQSQGYSELSGRTFYTKIRKLIADGYLVLSTNSSDRRKRSLELTDQGRAFIDTVTLSILEERHEHRMPPAGEQPVRFSPCQESGK